MNSQNKLSDIYVNSIIPRKVLQSKHHSLAEAYTTLYNEDTQQELEGIAPGSGEDEDMMAVFYIDKNLLTEEVVKQFRDIGGDGPIHIPNSYFSKVERRFRGKTIESLAHNWLAVSTKGKFDNVTYESLLNKLFAADIKGAEDLKELKQFIDWKNGDDTVALEDTAYTTLASDVASDVNFVELFKPNIEFFISSDPEMFLQELWRITEQSKRVGIGKGEIAISLLSRGFKGEPGDVKFKLSDQQNDLSVEVKGKGGRPGTSNYAHGLSDSLEKIIKKRNKNLASADVDDVQNVLYGTTLTTKWEALREWFNTTFRNKPVVRENSGRDGGDVVTDFINNLQTIVYTRSNKNAKAVVKQFKEQLEQLENWLGTIAPGQKNLIPGHVYEVLTKTTSRGLAFYIANRNLLRNLDSIVNLDSWQMVVRSFFNWFAKITDLNESELAQALVETRSDKIPKQASDLQDAIYTLLMREGKDIVYDKVTLGKLIAAIQFTGYCAQDGFNRALFIDDLTTLTGRVIPTYPDDMATTLDNVYSDFINNNYTIDMGIDKVNKGVQISYDGN